MGRKRAHLAPVREDRLASPAPAPAWTKPEAYVGAMVRNREFRRSRREQPRTQPQRPRLLLSTLPFIALIAMLALLAASMMIAAFPGHQAAATSKPAAPAHEQGVAPRGWLQSAQRDMRR